MKEKAPINWKYSGKNDFVNGTGAYLEEKLLSYLGSFLIPAILILMNLTGEIKWHYFQIIIALILGFELGGGMISNSLNSCKRFYHSEIKKTEEKIGKFLKNKILFALAHIHPFIIGLLYNSFDWKYGLYWYLIFMISVYIVFKTPLYLKRPVSMLMILIAILVNSFIITPIKGFEWFIPVLFLKIVYGHMVKEEPYRKLSKEPK